MDINGDGTITLDEIKAALAKDLPWSVKEARVLMILQAVRIAVARSSSLSASATSQPAVSRSAEGVTCLLPAA